MQVERPTVRHRPGFESQEARADERICGIADVHCGSVSTKQSPEWCHDHQGDHRNSRATMLAAYVRVRSRRVTPAFTAVGRCCSPA